MTGHTFLQAEVIVKRHGEFYKNILLEASLGEICLEDWQTMGDITVMILMTF